ncbi:hypothetical protein PLICBS_006465 [Purpureocillium lilacinum]|uniref:uncharacterized protein n=1 Tax=Purpureocillium lilacinum TaxID=33203 RepID=UPI0020812B93|nr:hypothetical protein PLICBS_006465 [Purpureocillium lilacinum]
MAPAARGMSIDDVTVIITTSPTPSAPGTDLVAAVARSFRTHCPDLLACPVILVLDTYDTIGAWPRLKKGVVTADGAAQYNVYKQNVKQLVLSEYRRAREEESSDGGSASEPLVEFVGEAEYGFEGRGNPVGLHISRTADGLITFIEPSRRLGFGLAVRSALRIADTPYVWVQQHDWPLSADIPLRSILRAMDEDSPDRPVKYVCLPSTRMRSYATSNHVVKFPALRTLTAALKGDFAASDDGDSLPLTPLFFWHDKPHVASRAHYLERVFATRLAIQRGGFIEDLIGQRARDQMKQGSWARSFLFGYDSGVMTDVIASKNFQNFFDTTDTSPIVGAINSTFSGGAVFGALFGGVIMDKYGRRRTIGVGALICTVGALLQAAAWHLAMMLVGRITAGFAIGLLSMSVPVYQSECANPKIRGLIVGLAQQMIGVGFIVSTWVGYGSQQMPDSSQFQWRFPLAFQALPSALLCIGMLWLPESPRHLIATDRLEEGMRILRTLHFDGTNEDWIQAEFQEIKMTIDAEKAATAPGWLIMFRVPQWRKRLALGTFVQVFTQFTGINVIGYYQTVMYESLGFTGNTKLLVAGVYNCCGPIANLIFIVFIADRFGRRKSLICGVVAITLALICESAINSQNTNGDKHSLSIVGVAFLFCVTIFFSLSFGPVSWIYMAEIMPYQIRAKGCAFATGIGNWLVSTFWAQVSPIALKELGWKFYFLFVAWNLVITLPALVFYFRETKGLSLEEIDLMFGGSVDDPIESDLKKPAAAVETSAVHDERSVEMR